MVCTFIWDKRDGKEVEKVLAVLFRMLPDSDTALLL